MCGRPKGGERTWSNCDRPQLSGLFPAVLRGDREGSPVGLGEPVQGPLLGAELEAARPEQKVEAGTRAGMQASLREQHLGRTSSAPGTGPGT